MTSSAVFVACSAVLPGPADLASFVRSWARGRSNERHIRSEVAVACSERARGTGPAEVDALLFALLRGAALAELRTAGQRWYRELPQVRTCPVTGALRAELATHRRCGRRVVLVSALPEVCARPLASAVGADAVLAPHLATDHSGGRASGLVSQPVLGRSRAEAVRLWAAAQGVHLAGSHAYGQNPCDLQMLAVVGRAVVVGDHPVLLAAAHRAGWSVLDAGRGAALEASA